MRLLVRTNGVDNIVATNSSVPTDVGQWYAGEVVCGRGGVRWRPHCGMVGGDQRGAGPGWGVVPWYHEQLAIIYQKQERLDDEVAGLQRYAAQPKAPGVGARLIGIAFGGSEKACEQGAIANATKTFSIRSVHG